MTEATDRIPARDSILSTLLTQQARNLLSWELPPSFTGVPAKPLIETVQRKGELAPAKAEAIFGARQLEVLKSLVDTALRGCTDAEVEVVLKALPPEADDEQRKAAVLFARRAFSHYPHAMDYLVDHLRDALSDLNVNMTYMVLNLLATSAGTLLLSGKRGPFDKLSTEAREDCFRNWRTSPISDLRKLAKTFTALPFYVLYLYQPDAIKATAYPHLGDPAKLAHPERVQKSYDYKFETIEHELQIFETEVLIIGSGSGGGVAAHTISNAGIEVMVVDKGHYLRTEDVTGSAVQGLPSLYGSRSTLLSEDGTMGILAGSTWGGGATVNWAASLRPPASLREQWAKQYGLEYWNTQDYDDDVEYVCKRMGVSAEHTRHSFANEKILAGAQRLGVHAEEVPQNTGGHEHYCGFCGNGCPFGEKQGSAVSWLRDAAENGAKFMQQTRVERILFGPFKGAPVDTNQLDHRPTGKNNVAIGALVTGPDGKQAVIRARRGVVVSGGSINSPAVLLRSGLRNKNIGKNLHLHPCGQIFATFNEDVRPWEGAILTTLSNEAANRDGTHFGAKLEVIATQPSSYAALSPWAGTIEHKKRMLAYRRSSTYIVLTRDRDSGSVRIDNSGQAVVDYVISPYDRISLIEGLVNGLRILLASGAATLETSQGNVESYVPAPGHKGVDDPAFLAWLKKVRRAGIQPMGAGLGSAHQMGTCRLGTKPSNSVANPRGQVWGTTGLYVCDASTFPTASGSNPMITTMSSARAISKFISQDLADEAARAKL